MSTTGTAGWLIICCGHNFKSWHFHDCSHSSDEDLSALLDCCDCHHRSFYGNLVGRMAMCEELVDWKDWMSCSSTSIYFQTCFEWSSATTGWVAVDFIMSSKSSWSSPYVSCRQSVCQGLGILLLCWWTKRRLTSYRQVQRRTCCLFLPCDLSRGSPSSLGDESRTWWSSCLGKIRSNLWTSRALRHLQRFGTDL